MVQFDLLSDRNFLGAVVVALVISFAMLGVFFFLALYMQDILGYSPLEAGVRFLPSTLMIVGVAPVAGRLSDRFGPRWLIGGGLLLVAASLLTFSGIAVHSSYLELLPGFMLLGIGIAMTMSPMTSAAMNAVPVEKAGIASGVLSMFRMVGGSLGVAVTGAIFQGLVSSHLGTLLAGSGISAADRSEISQQLGSGSVSGALKGLEPAQAKAAATAGAESFVYALGHAMSISAVVALVGAVIGVTAIRAKRKPVTSRLGGRRQPGRFRWRRRSRLAVGREADRCEARRRRDERGTSPSRAAIVSRLDSSIAARSRGPRGEDDGCDLEAGGAGGLDRQQGVVDRAQTGRRGDDQRQRQVDGEVAHRVAEGERDEQPADPLADERVGTVRRPRGPPPAAAPARSPRRPSPRPGAARPAARSGRGRSPRRSARSRRRGAAARGRARRARPARSPRA